MPILTRSNFQAHPFHLVSPSPWPLYTSLSLFTLTTSAVTTIHGFYSAAYWLICGFTLLLASMFFWFRDVISEGTYLGNHTLAVQKGLNMGVGLFIVSEALFFLAIFWAYFHSALSPTVELGGQWPPIGIEAINAFELPLFNTVLLLASGVTITYCHHSIIKGYRNGALYGGLFTIVLALVFTAFQGIEYSVSSFTLTDGAYGSCCAPQGYNNLCSETASIIGLILNLDRDCITLPLNRLITCLEGIAGVKSWTTSILFKDDRPASSVWYVQANKLDTLKCHIPRGVGLNCLQLYVILRLVNTIDRGAENAYTTSPRFNQCKGLRHTNGVIVLLRDLTASSNTMLLHTRGRSFHTRGRNEKILPGLKGKQLLLEESYNQSLQVKKDVSEAGPLRKTVKKISLDTLVKKDLQSYINKRGQYNGLINLLSKPEFLIACYEEIKGKPGNMTRGTTDITLDGISSKWFEKIGGKLKDGSYQFSPARMVLIPKANGKSRPLGINSPREKVIQKAIQAILEKIWEEIFLNTSHGFRPNRSTHTALQDLYLHGNNYSWVIQGDISGCFDNIPHNIIMERLGKIILCEKTLQLVYKTLKAGYIDPETDKLVRSYKGTPQGSVLSPLLSNIVLHELDRYMQRVKSDFEIGTRRSRKPSKEYERLNNSKRYAKTIAERRNILAKMRKMKSVDVMDPNYKRLLYVRYADDFVILIIGNNQEAINIKNGVKDILVNKCGLELNPQKTEITNLNTGFKFLGAVCRKTKNHSHVTYHERNKSAKITPKLMVFADSEKITRKLVAGKIAVWKGSTIRATSLKSLINLDHADIVQFYNSKLRGLLNYYSFAGNYSRLAWFAWIFKSSCALTLALKHKMRSQKKAFNKFGKHLTCPETGISIMNPGSFLVKHDYKKKVIEEKNLDFLNISWAGKLTKSNINQGCTICGSTNEVEMHHLRRVADVRAKIKTGKSTFALWSGASKRKQIPLCKYHHNLYHQGELNHSDIKKISDFY